MKIIPKYFTIILLYVVCGLLSCSDDRHHEILDRAESMMVEYPDSALGLLKDINVSDFGSGTLRARYSLLMSMALENNNIDVTSFDILQPAIDYYLDKGDATEKLRTYYSQGCILQNKGDREGALDSFVKAIDLLSDANDSLTVARAMVSMGRLYDEFYDFNGYTSSYLRAANLFKGLSLDTQEYDCLLNALNGAIILGNKSLGDSLLRECGKLNNIDDRRKKSLAGYRLSYIVEFDSLPQIQEYINSYQDLSGLDVNGLLNLALAYNKIGKYDRAIDLLEHIGDKECDILKYQAISVTALEGIGEYKGALANYKALSHVLDSVNASKFDQKAHYINERYQMELKAQENAKEKTKIIWQCICVLVLLVMTIVILILLVRSNRMSRDLANQKIIATELDNKRLSSEKERLSIENKNLQLEMDNKALEAENLAHRVELLESESDRLKKLLEANSELPEEVRMTIRVRIDMLNTLIAGYITSNAKFEKPYEIWVRELTKNSEEFMNSNRLAFQVSHPRFIRYFEDHGLTINEINYVCLYAIGLRGKDVGSYMKRPGHVNISSAIRKKLGIDKHETNIGIYVRKLLKDM